MLSPRYCGLISKTKNIAIQQQINHHSISIKQIGDIKTARDGYEISNSLNKPSIPALGFGTWGVDTFSHELVAKSVDIALKMGYRHVDCARIYGNEKEIGHVIADHLRNGNLKRDQLFITSKVFNNEWNIATEALESTLKDLQIDYVDAFLIHWPFQNMPNMTMDERLPYDLQSLFATHSKLYQLEKQGLTRSIGICNASIKKMKELISLCDKKQISRPGILQNEIHPYFQQTKLLKFCQSENIILTGFMPLGSPERPARSRRDDDPVVMADVELQNIAKESGYSVAQIIIRWHLQRGTVCIPKATEDWMIKQNLETVNFTLSEEQMMRINGLDKNFRYHRGEFLRWKEDIDWNVLWDYE